MKTMMRKFLFILALAVAISPVMAKDEKKTDKKDRARSGLVGKEKPTAKGKSQYKKIVVNINKAKAATFSAYLVGIGPVKAKAIVSHRSKNGKFSAIKELMNVEGIGESTFKGLKKNISTTRGETSPPKGYKMEETSGKKKAKSRSSIKKRVVKDKVRRTASGSKKKPSKPKKEK